MEKAKLVEFISINHHYMTISEMVEETGSNFPRIRRICDDNGWVPITIPERVKEFIESNNHLSFSEQADKLEITEETLKYHYQNFGIPIPNKWEIRAQEKLAEKESVQQAKSRSKTIDRKAITCYTQTGTDFLDNLHGIKTTTRNDRLII